MEKKITIEIYPDRKLTVNHPGCRGMTMEGMMLDQEEVDDSLARMYISYVFGAIMYDMQLDINNPEDLMKMTNLIEKGWDEQKKIQEQLSKEFFGDNS